MTIDPTVSGPQPPSAPSRNRRPLGLAVLGCLIALASIVAIRASGPDEARDEAAPVEIGGRRPLDVPIVDDDASKDVKAVDDRAPGEDDPVAMDSAPSGGGAWSATPGPAPRASTGTPTSAPAPPTTAPGPLPAPPTPAPPPSTTTPPSPPTTVSPPPPVTVTGPSTYRCQDGEPALLTIRWTTSNAISVDISIDYPGGLFETNLAAYGSLEIPAPCAPDQRTYYVIAKAADGSTQTATLVVRGI